LPGRLGENGPTTLRVPAGERAISNTAVKAQRDLESKHTELDLIAVPDFATGSSNISMR
jgi:hypothetical protein